MTRIVIDEPLLAQLRRLQGQVEFCDNNGVVLGSFTPTPASVKEWGRPQISDEELARRAEEGAGRTLAEILAGLAAR